MSEIFKFVNKYVESNLQKIDLNHLFVIYEFVLKHKDKKFIMLAINHMKEFIISNGEKFSNKNWEFFITVISENITYTIPTEIFVNEDEIQNASSETTHNSKNNFSIVKCISDEIEDCFSRSEANLFILEMINEIVKSYLENFNTKLIENVLILFNKSLFYLNKFNYTVEFRYNIWRSRFYIKSNEMPNLYRNQKRSLEMFFDLQMEILNYFWNSSNLQ